MGMIRSDIADPMATLIRRGQKEIQETERQRLAQEQQENRAKIDDLAAKWKETLNSIRAVLPGALSLCVQSPDYEPSSYDENIDQRVYYPVRLNLPGATPIRIWYHEGAIAYKAAEWSLQIDEFGDGKWFVGPTWGSWTWGKSAHEIRRLAGETSLAMEVARASTTEEQRETLQIEADRLNYERKNPTPPPQWFEEPLAQTAINRLRSNDHSAAQIYATLALAAEVRALRLMIANGDPHLFDALKEDIPLFGPASIPD